MAPRPRRALWGRAKTAVLLRVPPQLTVPGRPLVCREGTSVDEHSGRRIRLEVRPASLHARRVRALAGKNHARGRLPFPRAPRFDVDAMAVTTIIVL